MSSYQLHLIDETGQKSDTLTIPGDTRWAEVGALAVERLDLPTTLYDDEPLLYHLFDDQSGESLLPEQTVQEIIHELECDFRVRVAAEMQPAGVAG